MLHATGALGKRMIHGNPRTPYFPHAKFPREVPICLFGLIPFGVGLVLFTVSITGRGRL